MLFSNALLPLSSSLASRVGQAVVLLAALSGCGGMSSRPWFGASPQGYWLPLSVGLHLDRSVTEASLEYRDACRQSRTLSIGGPLTDSLTREIGLVFEHLQAGSSPVPGKALDGTVEVSLGLKELDLFVTRQGRNTYPAGVVLGATVNFLDHAGAVVYTKKLRSELRSEVETDAQGCAVLGLESLAKQVGGSLAQGLKESLGSSFKIRQIAEAKQAGNPITSAKPAPASQPPAPPVALSVPSAEPSGPHSLSFRALLRDGNNDQVLEGGEQFTVSVEVRNASSEAIPGVLVVFDGSPILVQQLAKELPVGDLQPGEAKRVEVSGTLPAVSTTQQAELILSLKTRGSGTQVRASKRFSTALRPARSDHLGAVPVDVDQVPPRARDHIHLDAVGVAIGVGTFRDQGVPGVKFAARDAMVMAKYLRTVGGIPAKQIRLLTDEQGLKDDLAELFEDWLPRQVKPGGSVIAFFSGRAWVDHATGAVWLLPYEGSPDSPQRSFSLRRLHAALERLPVTSALLCLDLTLTSASSPTPTGEGKRPMWATGTLADGNGKLVQLLGISSRQEAHQYGRGQHGLFTYYLLKGLAGEADEDENGVVHVGELFDYVRTQVPQTAKVEFGNEQTPSAFPSLEPNAKARLVPVARVK